MRSLLLALSLIAAPGCVYGPIQVSRATPRPNIDLDRQSGALALRIEPAVADRFEIPKTRQMRGVIVSDWHASLAAAFATSVAPAFDGAPTGPQRSLQLRRVSLEFVPVVTRQSGATVAVRASIAYQARLLGPAGETLAKSAGTVDAHRAIAAAADATANAGDAIARMFEQLADDFEPVWSAP